MRNGDYILVIAPADWQGKKYRGKYCYEHHLVYWQNTGITPSYDMTVHHKNGNKHDNRFKNLELISRSEHVRMHNLKKGKKYVRFVCPSCRKEFEKDYRNTHLVKPNNKYTACSRVCSGKFSHLLAANPNMDLSIYLLEVYKKYDAR